MRTQSERKHEKHNKVASWESSHDYCVHAAVTASLKTLLVAVLTSTTRIAPCDTSTTRFVLSRIDRDCSSWVIGRRKIWDHQARASIPHRSITRGG